MKVKIIGPEMGRSVLFEKAQDFLGKNKVLLGVKVLVGETLEMEEVYLAIILWRQSRGSLLPRPGRHDPEVF